MDDLAGLESAIRDLSDPMVIMRRVVDQAVLMIERAEGAVVELALNGELVYVCAGGTLAEHAGTRLALEGSLSGLAVLTGQTVCCADAFTDGRVDSEACRRVGAVSMVCVPLRRAGQAIGVLKVSAREPHAFRRQDVEKLASLAEFVSAAIAAVTDLSRITGELLDSGQPIADRHQHEGDRADHSGDVREFVANVLSPGVASNLTVRQRIERVLAESAFSVCCQPIVELDQGELVGCEALARFPGPPNQPPDVWFAEAQHAGLGIALQLAAVKAALALLDQIPVSAFLAINVGPDALTSPELPVLLDATGRPEQIVLELTEHLRIEDYPHLRTTLQKIRACGSRLAIDDTGAGFASLSHIVNLAPDLIKLDRQFTSGIDMDAVRRALAQALVSFARDTGARVVAEGIETTAELETVRQLGITYGQGYLFSRPVPVTAMPHNFASTIRRSSASPHPFTSAGTQC